MVYRGRATAVLLTVVTLAEWALNRIARGSNSSSVHTMTTTARFQRHHPTRRTAVQTLAAALLLPTLHPAHAQLAISTGINRVARFRALSQRMAKAYCQIFLNVLPDQARAVLASARQQMHAGFADLDKGQWNADMTRQLADVRKLAYGLDAQLAQPPGKDSVLAVAQQSDRMLSAADAATLAFEKLGKVGTVRLVNTAGRQRMLSQRLAKNYGLLVAGLAGKGVQEHMLADAAEFKQALVTLSGAPLSTAGIRSELALGEAQWLFFETALQRKPDARGLEDVATTSERLLEVMDKLTGLYDAALKDVLG